MPTNGWNDWPKLSEPGGTNRNRSGGPTSPSRAAGRSVPWESRPIIDRIVQTALRNVIEPIFEQEFDPGSYVFRPNRGCHDALDEIERLLVDGYVHVVDVDIRKYFDTIRMSV